MPTPAQRKLLERLLTGPKLRAQIEGSGRSRVPNDLRGLGWIKIDGDPAVKDPWGYPADSYYLTEEGRAALAGGASDYVGGSERNDGKAREMSEGNPARAEERPAAD